MRTSLLALLLVTGLAFAADAPATAPAAAPVTAPAVDPTAPAPSVDPTKATPPVTAPAVAPAETEKKKKKGEKTEKPEKKKKKKLRPLPSRSNSFTAFAQRTRSPLGARVFCAYSKKQRRISVMSGRAANRSKITRQSFWCVLPIHKACPSRRPMRPRATRETFTLGSRRLISAKTNESAGTQNS